MPVGPQTSSDSSVHRIRLHGPWQVAAVCWDGVSDPLDASDSLDFDSLRSLRSKAIELLSRSTVAAQPPSDDQRLEWGQIRGETLRRLGESSRLMFPADWRRWVESTRTNGQEIPQARSPAGSVLPTADRSKLPDDSANASWSQRWFWLSRHFGCPTGLSEDQAVDLVLQNFSQRGFVFLNSHPLGLLDASYVFRSSCVRSLLLQRNLIEILICVHGNEKDDSNQTAITEKSIYLEIA